MPTNITFSQEDSETLAKLTKEIQSRLDEIAKVATKTIGMSYDGVQTKFVPKKAEAPFAGMHIEILDNVNGEQCCVVWENWPNPPAKLFCPC